jgi:hypothetical protein
MWERGVLFCNSAGALFWMNCSVKDYHELFPYSKQTLN